MPTVVGPWLGGSSPARIEIDYSVSYNAEHTNAYFSGSVYLATEYSISDSVNTWNISGDLGSASGSNISFSHGSGGGRTKIRDIAGWKQGNASVSASVAGLQAPGVTVSATLTLLSGNLAPYITNFQASNIAPTSFLADIISANGNGGSLTNAQVKWNTSQSDTGASNINKGSYGDISVPGLVRATRYYFQMRVFNTTWGWGPWTSWKIVDTPSTVPGVPSAAWGFRDITQVDAFTDNLSVADNGGVAVTNWQVQWNTTESATGASSSTSGSGSTDAQLVNLLPGTTYYARIRAYNSNGWGSYSAWKSFTTLPGVYVKADGVWKNAIPYVKVNGVWVQVIRYIKDGGVWK